MAADPFKETPGRAVLSECGRYRYVLNRGATFGRSVLFVMLNPSTADAQQDDPTIRRLVGFARLWGFNAVDVVNLFAWRATDPRDLPTGEEAVGPLNDRYIREFAGSAEMIICAWGANPAASRRAGAVAAILRESGVQLHCLGVTSGGAPKHPLYLSNSTKPVAFDGYKEMR